MSGKNHQIEGAAKPRHIVVVVADSLRYDTTETQRSRLSYLEKNGTRFTELRSAGCWTLPAHASLFTGLMPHEHRATSQTRAIRPEFPRLAEQLADAGYHPYQITANVATTDIFGVDRGFVETLRGWDLVRSGTGRLKRALVMFGKPRVRRILLRGDRVGQKLAQDARVATAWVKTTAPAMFQRARRIIEEHDRRGERCFLFLNLMETHFPYHVHTSFDITSRDVADAISELRGLFHTVNQTFLRSGRIDLSKRVLRMLKRRQQRAFRLLAPEIDDFARFVHHEGDNLFVFLSDHGDNFGEQDWLYHFSNVTDAGNRTPLYWLDHAGGAGANRVPGSSIGTPVSARFFYHDILRSAGVQSDGPSLFSERPDSLPIMQSYWYDNAGRTQPWFRANRFAFVDGEDRYMHRGDGWFAARVSNGTEPDFRPLPPDAMPISDAVIDRERRSYLENSFASFMKFSASIRGSVGYKAG